MNTHRPKPEIDDLAPALRRQLRDLRLEMVPERDLWPGIASRLAGSATKPAQAPVAASRRGRPGRFASLALAASLVIAIAVAWQLQLPAGDTTSADPVARTPLLLRQAHAMDREYQAALREVQDARPEAAGSTDFAALDRGAAEIHAALERDPHAYYLLGQLQRVYALRLELTLKLPRSI